MEISKRFKSVCLSGEKTLPKLIRLQTLRYAKRVLPSRYSGISRLKGALSMEISKRLKSVCLSGERTSTKFIRLQTTRYTKRFPPSRNSGVSGSERAPSIQIPNHRAKTRVKKTQIYKLIVEIGRSMLSMFSLSITLSINFNQQQRWSAIKL